jgi:hypothetical protein
LRGTQKHVAFILFTAMAAMAQLESQRDNAASQVAELISNQLKFKIEKRE